MLRLSIVMFAFCQAVAIADEMPDPASKYLGVTTAWINSTEVRDVFKKLNIPRPPGRGGLIILTKEAIGSLTVLQVGDVITSIDEKPLLIEKDSVELLKTMTLGSHDFSLLRGQVNSRGKKQWERLEFAIPVRTYQEHVLACMKHVTDEFTNREVMFHREASNRAFNSTGIVLRIAKNGDKWSPLFNLNLANRETLFVTSFYVLVDDESVKFPENECDVKREYRGALTFEWATISGKKVVDTTKKMSNAKRVAIRFVGENLTVDHECSSDELARLILTARAFEMLTGK